MKKLFKLLVVTAMLLSLLAACAPATAIETAVPTLAPTEPPLPPATPEPLHLKIGTFNYISNAPIFIARDEGYFTEEGLEVELVDFGSSSNEALPALFSRQLDMVGNILTTAVFNAISQGNNVKFVADKGFMNPNDCVTDAWVASNSIMASGRLDTADGIKGINLVFPPGGTIEYVADTLLAEYGLTQKDVNLSNVADSAARIEGLKNGSVDVSVLSEPWITSATTDDAGQIWRPFSSLIAGQSLGAIIFGPGILEDKPEAGVRFMRAYLKAVKQFNQGKTDRNVEIISAYTKLAPEDVKASCWTNFKSDGLINTDGMLAFQQWALDKGYVDSLLELDQFWTAEFVEEASTSAP